MLVLYVIEICIIRSFERKWVPKRVLLTIHFPQNLSILIHYQNDMYLFLCYQWVFSYIYIADVLSHIQKSCDSLWDDIYTLW